MQTEIWGTLLVFLCVLYYMADEKAQISVEDWQSSRVLHLQVLYIILVYAVYVQPFLAFPPKFISKLYLASSACFGHTLLLQSTGMWEIQDKHKRAGTLDTSLERLQIDSYVYFPNCMYYSIKKICIPLTEIMCLSETMKSGMHMFLEREKGVVLSYRYVKMYQIMSNIIASLVLYSNK